MPTGLSLPTLLWIFGAALCAAAAHLLALGLAPERDRSNLTAIPALSVAGWLWARRTRSFPATAAAAKYRMRTLFHGKIQGLADSLYATKMKAATLSDIVTIKLVKMSQSLAHSAASLADTIAMALSSASLGAVAAIAWSGGGLLLLFWIMARAVSGAPEERRVRRTRHGFVIRADGTIDWSLTDAAPRESRRADPGHPAA